VFKIPDELALDDAAPYVYSLLRYLIVERADADSLCTSRL